MLPLLPPVLVALILASPVLSVSISSNDPFKALAVQVVKVPEPPVCCLIPLSSAEPLQDDLLLSFEEWKEKRFTMQTPVEAKAKEHDGSTGERGTESREPATPAAEVSSSPAPPQDAPHIRVPITDRFNYASLDCSARVHTTHRTAKSSSSILSSKRDRYMLSPCRPPKEEMQFIVVELCEDIRIDTVQLANFEFFSGVFKDFTVSVAKTYTTDPDGWTFASAHTAKNIRVVQSFHPPTTLRDFYRFIRIDFHSHYGNEYYCPISLLRVYGLTHLEEYKWEIWQEESSARARLHEQQAAPSPPPEVIEPEPAPAPEPLRIPPSYSEYVNTAVTEEREESSASAGTQAEIEDQPVVSPALQSRDTIGRMGPEELLPPARCESSVPADCPSSSVSTQSTTTADQNTPQTKSSSETSTNPKVIQHISTTLESLSASSNGSDPMKPPTHDAPTSDASARTAAATTVSTGVLSSASALTTTSQAPAPASGESIYRTIMNRLTALEANHTLYARYVEEHTAAVREMLRRVGEDLGRAEGVGKAQAQIYLRTMEEWERRQRLVDAEHRELLQRVEYLSSEIVLEKRLGIAQLLLLLAVLVFMTLTRGSRGEMVAPPITSSSLRAWGRRHLSLRSLSRSGSGSGSGDWDWVGRLKSRSRSRSPQQQSVPKRETSPGASACLRMRTRSDRLFRYPDKA
ncbi:UNC-like C-terminal-domain-containing protein [Mycena pura]|uniref:UNC-like C-terminal-domain-containing protein n=1 Tax=Mycena pura TaxID=153505 RepID=A0AAD6V8G2_9AGAR|nr:UNC-like C-terminal-domain-containing protein [Mycena pura]